MLRIAITDDANGTTLALHGRLAGPWVRELAQCWAGVSAARDARSIRVSLDAVSFVDDDGKALLRLIHDRGAALSASGCMNRAVVDEITGSEAPRLRAVR